MLESQIDQEERRRTLQNDVRVREQTGTYLSHTHDDIHQGRFAAIGPAQVIGSKADVASAYPAASSAHQVELPPEPPTGYCIDDMEPLEQPPALPAQGNSGDAPSPTPLCDVAASPFSSGDPGDGLVSQPSKHAPERAPGSSPLRRF